MRTVITTVTVLLALLLAGGVQAQERGFVFMASTIGPIDAGIVGALEQAFEKETGITVRHVGAGTGAALNIARQGSVDLVLVHAREWRRNSSQRASARRGPTSCTMILSCWGPHPTPPGSRG